MSATVQYPTEVAGEPMELLHTMLEEQFAVHTNRLAELTVYGRLPGRAGHDVDELHVLAAHARQGIADTAQALRRMTEGTYGICADCRKPIPLGRLHSQPDARQCVRCQRRRPH
jgi:DnaK suppressor protein